VKSYKGIKKKMKNVVKNANVYMAQFVLTPKTKKKISKPTYFFACLHELKTKSKFLVCRAKLLIPQVDVLQHHSFHRHGNRLGSRKWQLLV